jgi:glycosyltransferase involved in cell wall biosynthesis
MKPVLYVLDTCTEHSAQFLVNVLRILSEWYEIRGCYCWCPSKDDLDALRPFSFRRFNEGGFTGGELAAELASLKPSLVICWNKHYPLYDAPLRFLRERMPGCRVIYSEVAWFPQREHIYFDAEGVNADSSLAALTPRELMRLDVDRGALAEFVERYREGHRVTKGDFVFCPLQIPSDMNIARFSPWKDMKAFLRHVVTSLPGEKILFKCHPLDPDKSDYFRLAGEMANIQVSDSVDLKWCLANCARVAGINSTVLLEALVFDKAATYLGAGIGSNKEGLFNYDLSAAAHFVPDAELRDRFLYELVFRRQISVKEPERDRVYRFIPLPGKETAGDAASRALREGAVTSGTGAAPAVSVVIPCYNLGAYIGQTIASVRAQTMRDFEIVIVDDGSTDEATIRILDRLSPSDIRLIRTENRGLSAARNTGIRASRGRFLCCLDSDDLLEPSCLGKCVAALDADPGLGFVSFGYRMFGGEEGEIRPGALSLLDFLVTNCSPPSAPFRREAWERAGGYDESFRGYEDWDFWIGVLEAGYRCRVLDEVLFSYRVRPDSLVRSCDVPDASAELRRKILQKHAASYRAHALEALAEKERLIASYRFYWKNAAGEAERLARHHAEATRYIRELEAQCAKLDAALEEQRRGTEDALRAEGERAAALEGWLAEREHELRAVYGSKAWRFGSAVQRTWRALREKRA